MKKFQNKQFIGEMELKKCNPRPQIPIEASD
jgi:hypothetical protein